MGFWEQLKETGFAGRRLDVALGEAMDLPEVLLTQPTSPDAATVVPHEEDTENNIQVDASANEPDEADESFELEIAEDDVDEDADLADMGDLDEPIELTEQTEPEVIRVAMEVDTEPDEDTGEDTGEDAGASGGISDGGSPADAEVGESPVESEPDSEPEGDSAPAIAADAAPDDELVIAADEDEPPAAPEAEASPAIEDDPGADEGDGDTMIFRRPPPGVSLREDDEPPHDTAEEPFVEDTVGEDTVTDGQIPLTLEVEEEEPAPARYANSLRLPDPQVIAILREENYPHLEDVSDDTLYQLSRLEEVLMERAVELGESYRKLAEKVVPARDLWQAAIWVTGMHRDPMMREGLRRLREEGSSSTARWLGWMVWPYTEELLGAASGLDDPAGLAAACDALGEALSRRAALIRTGPHSLSLEAARYPSEAQGIFRREGFSWL